MLKTEHAGLKIHGPLLVGMDEAGRQLAKLVFSMVMGQSLPEFLNAAKNVDSVKLVNRLNCPFSRHKLAEYTKVFAAVD